MNKRHKMGMAIVAGGLAFVGAANAGDLIVNGSFETPNAGEWSGFFKTYNFTAAYYDGPAIPASENPGSNYSWQHTGVSGVYVPATPVTQTVSLTNSASPAHIDAGLGQFTFSAWLASYTSNLEQPYLTLQFFDSSNNQVGSSVIFDRTTNDLWVAEAGDPDVIPATDPSAVPPDASNHFWAKYANSGTVPPGARTATVGIMRSPNAGLNGSPDTYVDLVKLDVEDASLTVPTFNTGSPRDGATNLAPSVAITVTLQDKVSAVDTNTVQLFFDGTQVTPVILKSGQITTVSYNVPGALASLSAHNYKVVFGDNGSPVTTQSQTVHFTIAAYNGINLPAPIYFENFDSVTEGSLPTGWTQTNFTDVHDTTFDLGNLNSESYASWLTVDVSRFTNSVLTYDSGTPLTYIDVVRPNPFAVENGQVVTNLGTGQILFSASGYRSGLSQVDYTFTPDYDLSAHTNVFVSFHSLYEQNQDSIGALEYSIDQGATWLPVVYLINRPAILTDASGNIDPVATFATDHSAGQTILTDVPVYTDPSSGLPVGGNYGAFIGVASNQWSTLAPYLSGRVDDNPVESKRVELYSLPLAAGQAHVRLRFAYAGTDSWYWGVDNLGIYSIDPSTIARPLVQAPTTTSPVVAVGNSASLSVSASGISPFFYQWRHAGVNIPGATSPNLIIPDFQLAEGGSYDVVVSNVGGATTSAAPAVTITAINPLSTITGQWDFGGSLKATVGTDLQYFDATVAGDTTFGTASSLSLPLMGTNDVTVAHLVPTVSGWGGLIMAHGAAPNGGGTNVNQYTVIYDLFYPANVDLQWRALLQTDITNTTDADVYVNDGNGIGISSVYQGNVTAGAWHRIAIAFDLTGPGVSPVLTKFIDGVKVGEQTTGLSAKDGRFSLLPTALLFADGSIYNNEVYVSSVQFSNGRRSDAYLESLGGPTASKIPGILKAALQGGSLTLTWTGGAGLESAPSPSGPWTAVAGSTSPYVVNVSAGAARFYRIALH